MTHAIDEDLSIIVLCNLAGIDPMRIAERIAQVYLPALKPAALTVLSDPDPQLAARVQALVDATASGQLQASTFEFLRAGFFPERPAAYAKMLQGRTLMPTSASVAEV